MSIKSLVFLQCQSLKVYKDYVEMYRSAVECLKRHRQENETFHQFIEVSKVWMGNAHVQKCQCRISS